MAKLIPTPEYGELTQSVSTIIRGQSAPALNVEDARSRLRTIIQQGRIPGVEWAASWISISDNTADTCKLFTWKNCIKGMSRHRTNCSWQKTYLGEKILAFLIIHSPTVMLPQLNPQESYCSVSETHTRKENLLRKTIIFTVYLPH